jgi:hypothetical protein
LALCPLACSVTPPRDLEPAPAAAGGERRLGQAPLCEASAAAVAGWDRQLVLVADNEVDDRLFTFRVAADGSLEDQHELILPGSEHPADIEALATAGDRLLVVGSHGRNARCERRPKRERLQILVWDDDGGSLREHRLLDNEVLLEQALTSVTSCLERLFVSPEPVHARAVCSAWVSAQRAANPERCIPPLDIEGAATLAPPGEQADARFWLGMRQPRVDGNAILVRLLADPVELRFDGVVLIPHGDRGIRDLCSCGEYLWAILGPGAPSFASSSLWRAPSSAIVPGAVVAGEVVADELPPSTEGLLLRDGALIAITDGAEPSARGQLCERPATQLRIELAGDSR